VEIIRRQIILGALVFKQVHSPEERPDGLLDDRSLLFLDDHHIYPERLGVQRMLKLKAQDIPILVEFQADGVIEGGMPGNGLFFPGSGYFAVDTPPSCIRNIA
jgi:hypothetical protein